MDLGLLQQEVAKILKVTCSSIENWERNRGFPNKMHMLKIKEFLGKYNDFIEPEKELGRRLKDFRNEYQITQKDLAKKTGIGLNTVIAIEGSKNHILDSTLQKVEDFLKKC